MLANSLPRDENGQLLSYVWPGGYPIYYLDGENSVLCADCARESDEDEIESFRPCASDINYEDLNLYCYACNERIKPAYSVDCEVCSSAGMDTEATTTTDEGIPVCDDCYQVYLDDIRPWNQNRRES